MALITCTECAAEVSDRAAACPKCGNPLAVKPERSAAYTYMPPPPEEKSGGWLKWVVIAAGSSSGRATQAEGSRLEAVSRVTPTGSRRNQRGLSPPETVAY